MVDPTLTTSTWTIYLGPQRIARSHAERRIPVIAPAALMSFNPRYNHCAGHFVGGQVPVNSGLSPTKLRSHQYVLKYG